MTGRRLSPSEQRAWSAVTRGVRRISGPDPLSGTPPAGREDERAGRLGGEGRDGAKDARKMSTERPYRVAVDHGSTGKQAGRVADRGGERKVRRGQVPFTARLDLHGHTQSSADAALRQFLTHHRQSGARCVLVITGKGRDGQSVLKRNFIHWVESPAGRSLVSGVASAHARHGGGGAFYVWLRRRDPGRTD